MDFYVQNKRRKFESNRLKTFWVIVRDERKNVLSRKTRLKFSEHKNCKKKLLTLNQWSLLHIILFLLDIFVDITCWKMQQTKIDFSKVR